MEPLLVEIAGFRFVISGLVQERVMSDDSLSDNDPPKQMSVRDLALFASERFQFDTDHLGRLTAREPSLGMLEKFLEQSGDIEKLDDRELVKNYLLNIAGRVPLTESEDVQPLDAADKDTLTERDLIAFARAYLGNVVEIEVLDGAAVIFQLADYVRAECRSITNTLGEAVSKLSMSTDTIRNLANAMTIDSSVMRHWGELQNKGLLGDLGKIGKDLHALTGATTGIDKILKTALDSPKLNVFNLGLSPNLFPSGVSVRSRMLEAGNESATHDLLNAKSGLPLFDVNATTTGRTANATEQLAGHGLKLVESMAEIVTQVGAMANMIGQVSVTIRDESRESQKENQRQNNLVIKSTEAQSQKSLSYSRRSLYLSCLALAVAAFFSMTGYFADRNDAKTNGLDAQAMISELKTQNMLLVHVNEALKEQNDSLSALTDKPPAPKLDMPTIKRPAPKSEMPATKPPGLKLDTPTIKPPDPKQERPTTKSSDPKLEKQTR